MSITHHSTDERPYTYSRRWRMKYNNRRHCTATGYRNASVSQLTYVIGYKSSSYVYDEYLSQFYDTELPLGGPIGLREIPGFLITHEIGDSENDYTLDKIIVDMHYDKSRYGFYTYDVNNPDPTVTVETRSIAYADDTPTNRIELVALNQAAMPSINPFVSVRQAPGDTDVAPNDANITRESLALVTPIAKFRRIRVEIGTNQKTTSIRSMAVMMTEFPRRTWG